jgi:hypothetical protein
VGELVFSFSNEFSWMTNKVARLRWVDIYLPFRPFIIMIRTEDEIN